MDSKPTLQEEKIKLKVTAKLFEDPKLVKKLMFRGLMEGAPLIGFLDATEDITIHHASESGKPTGEHAPVKLTKGKYAVLGKRELDAY